MCHLFCTKFRSETFSSTSLNLNFINYAHIRDIYTSRPSSFASRCQPTHVTSKHNSLPSFSSEVISSALSLWNFTSLECCSYTMCFFDVVLHRMNFVAGFLLNFRRENIEGKKMSQQLRAVFLLHYCCDAEGRIDLCSL